MIKLSHPLQNDFCAALRQRREELKLTQETVAEKIGVSAMGLSHWETGRRKIKISDLEKWSEALGYNIEINLFEPKEDNQT